MAPPGGEFGPESGLLLHMDESIDKGDLRLSGKVPLSFRRSIGL